MGPARRGHVDDGPARPRALEVRPDAVGADHQVVPGDPLCRGGRKCEESVSAANAMRF